MGVYKRTTVGWARGIFHNHQSPDMIRTGGGTEVLLTPIDYAYGTIDAGNRVVISSGAVTNGVTERNGIILPPALATQAQKVANVTTLTGALPANGLFQPNANPAHNYLIETNPALTNLDTFYGSDYALSRMGFDPNAEANKRLGDAFYETRLVREQIFELTGRRFFEDGVTSDTAQMVALMDNAVQAHSDLNLSVGIALSADQVAALTSDIVWFEYQEVNGQQVLVPVVYLGSTSLDRIIQGGSVIVGRDVLIEASGEVSNHGVMVAANDIEITANTIFNRQGSISGQAVGLTATDSVRVMGGIIKGDTVALKAGNDVVIASDTVEFKDRDTTATQIAMAGKVEAANSLSIEAGRDIGILGAEVAAGGDATLTAGENIAISTVETQTKSATSGSGYNSHSESVTNRRSTVTTGGTLTADAGADLAIHGSQIAADGDIALKAGGNVSITAATDSSDLYAHGEGGKGGFFGGKSSFTLENKNERTIASTLASGGSVTVQAGAGGSGDVVLQGSRVTAGQDATLKAEGDIQTTPNRIENSHKFEEEKSGFMGTKSMASDESNTVAHTRPEIEAGGKVTLDARDDVILQAARITSGDETEITAQDGQVAMLVAKDSEYKREVKSDMGFLTWSSSDKGNLDETVIHTLIDADKGLTITTPQGVVVEFKESTGDVRKDAELLANVEGLQWMGDLLQRDDVDWVAVQEIHDQWSKSDGGLAPGGMLIVAIIASAVTAGAASSLAAACSGLTVVNGAVVTAGATAGQLAMHAALTAAFTSLSAQVATSLADAAAGGDLGTNLSNIVSVDGLRSLATTMIMAGIISTYGSDFAKMGPMGEIAAKTAVKTATSTIVGGQDLEGAFRTALGSTFASYAKGEITSDQLNDTVNLILTGATGAAGSAIAGGDPMQGALSAIVAELAEQIKAPELTEEQKAEARPYALVSKAVYDEGKLPENLKEVDLVAKGIKPEIMKTTSTGLQSKLYQNKDTGEYIIAFSGSNEALDWNSNIDQAKGDVGEQYAQLDGQLQSIRNALGRDSTIVATGHSLGGGIATAAASTKYVDKAVVFNPAGVHENTIATLNPTDTEAAITRASSTTAYVSRGDMLTNMQDLLGFMLPTTVGKRVVVEGGGVHFMDDMVKVFQ